MLHAFKYCLLLGLAGLAKSQTPIELSFIHINDLHAKYEPVSVNVGTCAQGDNELGLCYGGLSRIVTATQQLEAAHPNSILLNAGDNFQGSLLYSLFKWNITVEMMNRIPFVATALGNHEFDDKVEGVEPYMSGLISPIVAVNMDVSLEPSLAGKYLPSIVIQRGGRNIGIIGSITKYTPNMASSENVIFNDEYETVSAEATRLRSQGVDIIVLLSHSGYDVDQRLAQNVTDLDIIVGAHSHSFLYTGTPPSVEVPVGEYPTVVTQSSGRTVLIVQAYCFSKYVGVLNVVFDAVGEVVSWTGVPMLLDASVPEDPATKAALQPWVDEANILGLTPLGTSAVLLTSNNCYSGECNLGNFYTDAMVAEQVDMSNLTAGWTKAALAIMNPGGIRAPLGENPNITYNDLVNSQPFGNTIDTIELQGKDIREILEMSASEFWAYEGYRDFTTGKGCMQISGMKLTYNFASPINFRLIDMQVLCANCQVPVYEPLDHEAWYNIAMPSYLSNGGSGFNLIPERGRNKVVGLVDVDIFSKYITAQSPITQGVEGRVRVI